LAVRALVLAVDLGLNSISGGTLVYTNRSEKTKGREKKSQCCNKSNNLAQKSSWE